jgi:hypothetical protein
MALVQYYDPAFSIVRKLGGNSEVARITGRDRSAVWRWTVGPDSNGLSGVIPMIEAKKILRHARAVGIDIDAADFFAPATPATMREEDNNGTSQGIEEQA